MWKSYIFIISLSLPLCSFIYLLRTSFNYYLILVIDVVFHLNHLYNYLSFHPVEDFLHFFKPFICFANMMHKNLNWKCKLEISAHFFTKTLLLHFQHYLQLSWLTITLSTRSFHFVSLSSYLYPSPLLHIFPISFKYFTKHLTLIDDFHLNYVFICVYFENWF